MTSPRCPYCLDDLLPEQESVRCARCRTPHHAACFAENGACVAYGCLGKVEVKAGMSLFNVQAITIQHQCLEAAPLGPFELGWRRLAPLPETRAPSRCPSAYARLSLEGRELREGGALRGRAVVYAPVRLRWRRIDLLLSQGIARPQAVTRVTLAAAKDGAGDLEVGSHPFHLELRAPPTTGPVDPFVFELVVVQGLLSELRSPPLPVFLLEALPSPVEQQAHAIRILPRPAAPPPEARPATSADAGGPPTLDAGGWRPLVVEGDRADPARTAVAARFVPGVAGASDLDLRLPPMLHGAEVPIVVSGAGALASLTIALRWELVRPGGGDVAAGGLPAIEEVRVLGPQGLEAARFGREAVEVVARAAEARFGALAAAREAGSHNAALRLRVGVDAYDATGRVRHGPTRTATFAARA